MATTRSVWLLAMLAGLGACASSPADDPDALHAQCRLELNAARTAVHLREQGKSRADMLHTLPPLQADSTRLLQQMHEIVEEAYTYPDLNDVVYGIYRYDKCVRALNKQTIPALKTIYPQLQQCQAQYGRLATKQAVSCVRNAYPRITNSSVNTP